MARKKGSTKASTIQRVTIVYKLLINGTSRQEIFGIIMNKYDVTDTQVDNYISKANERIVEQAEITIEKETGLALARLDDLYKGARSDKDRKVALAVQDQRNKITGVYAPKQVDVNNNVTVINTGMDMDEL